MIADKHKLGIKCCIAVFFIFWDAAFSSIFIDITICYEVSTTVGYKKIIGCDGLDHRLLNDNVFAVPYMWQSCVEIEDNCILNVLLCTKCCITELLPHASRQISMYLCSLKHVDAMQQNYVRFCTGLSHILVCSFCLLYCTSFWGQFFSCCHGSFCHLWSCILVWFVT